MEQETKKKKKIYQVTEYPKYNEIYSSEEFLEKLDEYYNIYGTFDLTAKRLTEDFKIPVDRHSIAKLYKKCFAIKLGTEENAKFFENSFIRMQKRFEDAWEMIGDLTIEYKKMRRIIKEKSQDDLTQALTFMKMAPQIISLAEAIRKQLEFISKKQEEIKVFQQNNLIISPVQINQQIKSMFTTMPSKDIQSFFESIEDERFKKISRHMSKILVGDQ